MAGLKCDDGMCLAQVDFNNIYYRKYECDCEPIPCGNVEICGQWLPLCILNAHNGNCMNCAISVYGNLEISLNEEKEECAICLEVREKFAKMPSCSHKFCLYCMEKLMFPWIKESRIDDHKPPKIISKEEAELINGNEDEDEDNENGVPEEEHLDEDAPSINNCPLCRKDFWPSWRK